MLLYAHDESLGDKLVSSLLQAQPSRGHLLDYCYLQANRPDAKSVKIGAAGVLLFALSQKSVCWTALYTAISEISKSECAFWDLQRGRDDREADLTPIIKAIFINFIFFS